MRADTEGIPENGLGAAYRSDYAKATTGAPNGIDHPDINKQIDKLFVSVGDQIETEKLKSIL